MVIRKPDLRCRADHCGWGSMACLVNENGKVRQGIYNFIDSSVYGVVRHLKFKHEKARELAATSFFGDLAIGELALRI